MHSCPVIHETFAGFGLGFSRVSILRLCGISQNLQHPFSFNNNVFLEEFDNFIVEWYFEIESEKAKKKASKLFEDVFLFLQDFLFLFFHLKNSG